MQWRMEEPTANHPTARVWWMVVAVMCITHVHGLQIRAIIPQKEIPTAQAIRLRVLQEVLLLTAHRHTTTVCRRGASRITARLAEAIRLQEANLTARRPVRTVSRLIALLREVTARHPAVAAVVAAVRAVLQEVQDNLRLS